MNEVLSWARRLNASPRFIATNCVAMLFSLSTVLKDVHSSCPSILLSSLMSVRNCGWFKKSNSSLLSWDVVAYASYCHFWSSFWKLSLL